MKSKDFKIIWFFKTTGWNYQVWPWYDYVVFNGSKFNAHSPHMIKKFMRASAEGKLVPSKLKQWRDRLVERSNTKNGFSIWMVKVDNHNLRIGEQKRGGDRPLLLFNGFGAPLETAASFSHTLRNTDTWTFDIPGIGASPATLCPTDCPTCPDWLPGCWIDWDMRPSMSLGYPRVVVWRNNLPRIFRHDATNWIYWLHPQVRSWFRENRRRSSNWSPGIIFGIRSAWRGFTRTLKAVVMGVKKLG